MLHLQLVFDRLDQVFCLSGPRGYSAFERFGMAVVFNVKDRQPEIR